MKRLDRNGRRGDDALCRSLETIAWELKDRDAVNNMMGHADASMAGGDRERIGGERLLAVAVMFPLGLFSE